MSCFYRCVFPDVIMGLLYMCSSFFDEPPFTKQTCYSAIGGIFIALILNITWVCIYLDPWWNTDYVDAGSLKGLRQYEVVMCFILMFFELVAMCMLGYLSVFLSNQVSGHQVDYIHDNRKYGGGPGYDPRGGYGGHQPYDSHYDDPRNRSHGMGNSAYYNPYDDVRQSRPPVMNGNSYGNYGGGPNYM